MNHDDNDSTPKKLILIIEDDANVAKAMRRVLENEGYEIVTADNGFEAGVCLGHHQPDLITLDLKMPEMDGEEVLECIRHTDYLHQLKIMIVSGLEESELREFLKKGADDYLAKPFKNEDLIAKAKALTGS